MELIVATQNRGKQREFDRILSPLGIRVLAQVDVCPQIEVEETGATFAANARLKAEAIYHATGITTVADDSGLCVDALDGAPGVYSARYAGENATDADRVVKLLEALRDVPTDRRGARFVSAICCIGSRFTIECEGVCEGSIGYQPLGDEGFGYDPIFMVGARSYSQMSGNEKDQISHRGQALRLFYDEMNRRLKRADQ